MGEARQTMTEADRAKLKVAQQSQGQFLKNLHAEQRRKIFRPRRIRISDEGFCAVTGDCCTTSNQRQWLNNHDLYLGEDGRGYTLVTAGDFVYFMDAITGALCELGRMVTNRDRSPGRFRRDHMGAKQAIVEALARSQRSLAEEFAEDGQTLEPVLQPSRKMAKTTGMNQVMSEEVAGAKKRRVHDAIIRAAVQKKPEAGVIDGALAALKRKAAAKEGTAQAKTGKAGATSAGGEKKPVKRTTAVKAAVEVKAKSGPVNMAERKRAADRKRAEA